MNKTLIADYEKAVAFAKEKITEDNTVDMVETKDGQFSITWIKNKKFIAFDGKEYTDEVWTKEDGTMIVCQDLELEHARNIIRMILRNDRSNAQMEALTQSLGSLLSQLGLPDDEDDTTNMTGPGETRVLH